MRHQIFSWAIVIAYLIVFVGIMTVVIHYLMVFVDWIKYRFGKKRFPEQLTKQDKRAMGLLKRVK